MRVWAKKKKKIGQKWLLAQMALAKMAWLPKVGLGLNGILAQIAQSLI